MSQQKILVTGGTGYIGSHTILEIIRTTDYQVISIDNHERSHAHTTDRIRQITGKDVTNYDVDLKDFTATKTVFEENPDITGVIHFAAFKAVGESVDKPLLYYDNNINSLLNILKCCQKFQVSNFIFSSSCSVYGNVEKLPVNEGTPLQPAESPYAHTKQIGEDIIINFTKVNDANAISLRYFNPVGADMTGLNGENNLEKPNNLVPLITEVASGIRPKLTVFGGDYPTRDGSCIRDYIHVTDIATAHIKALNYLIEARNNAKYEVFNLGAGLGVSVFEAINAFEKISGVKLNYEVGERRAGDVTEIYSDSSKAEKLLGWSCKYSISDMMESAWKWQQLLNKEKKKEINY